MKTENEHTNNLINYKNLGAFPELLTAEQNRLKMAYNAGSGAFC